MAAVWKCPGSPEQYVADLDPAYAQARGCILIAARAEPSASAPSNTSSNAAPPNWRFLSYGADDCSYHWDPSTYSTKGAYSKAWFMQSCSDPKKLGVGEFNTNLSRKFLLYFNCPEQTTAMVQQVLYSGAFGAGMSGTSQQYPVQPSLFNEAPPNTLGAAWLLMVCAKNLPMRK
jgi:hypothetical protein